jgi:hypothetical protein
LIPIPHDTAHNGINGLRLEAAPEEEACQPADIRLSRGLILQALPCHPHRLAEFCIIADLRVNHAAYDLVGNPLPAQLGAQLPAAASTRSVPVGHPRAGQIFVIHQTDALQVGEHRGGSPFVEIRPDEPIPELSSRARPQAQQPQAFLAGRLSIATRRLC